MRSNPHLPFMVVSMANNNIWISANKNWRIETINNRLMVTNLKIGINDNPVIYDNGSIGFDFTLPKYITTAVYEYVQNHKEMYE